MTIAGRMRGIDFCIVPVVAALNAAGIITISSCCGHGKIPGIISLEDKRELSIEGPIPLFPVKRLRMVIDNETTGQEARRRRLETGISLRKLAKLIGICAPYLSDLELGKRNWSDDLRNSKPGRWKC